MQESIIPDENVFVCVDKLHNPYLMAASFQRLIRFYGSFVKDGILHWQFTPKDRAIELIDQLEAKTEPRIPILDFASAADKFWKNVAIARKSKEESR